MREIEVSSWRAANFESVSAVCCIYVVVLALLNFSAPRKRPHDFPRAVATYLSWVGIMIYRSRKHRIRSTRIRGFSLVELLTVIAVIGLLLSFLMPAIQVSRESARKAHCSNNLKQIGLAMHGFESTYGHFPPMNSDQIPIGLTLAEMVALHSYPLSAQYCILPQLDQSALYSSIDLKGDIWNWVADPPTSLKNAVALSTSIPVFSCPSDTRRAGGLNYLISFGTSSQGYTTPDHLPPNSAIAGVGCGGYGGKGASAAAVSDGQSNTVAFAERLLGDQVVASFCPYRNVALLSPSGPPPLLPDDFVSLCSQYVSSTADHTSFGGIGWLFHCSGITAYNHIMSPNSRIPDCGIGSTRAFITTYTARSFHSQGAFTLYVDGSVRFSSDATDLNVWRAIGTINGAERGLIP